LLYSTGTWDGRRGWGSWGVKSSFEVCLLCNLSRERQDKYWCWNTWGIDASFEICLFCHFF
jgi:hypothetical protein